MCTASQRLLSTQLPFLHKNINKPFSQILQKRRHGCWSDTCIYASSSVTAKPINKLFNHSHSPPPANHFSIFHSSPKDARSHGTVLLETLSMGNDDGLSYLLESSFWPWRRSWSTKKALMKNKQFRLLTKAGMLSGHPRREAGWLDINIDGSDKLGLCFTVSRLLWIWCWQSLDGGGRLGFTNFLAQM